MTEQTEPPGRISPDGRWQWDGAQWVAYVAPGGKTEVKVRKYTNNYVLEKDMAKWIKKGYRVQDHVTRKAAFSLLAGIFTRKQIHTVTYVKP